MLTDVREYIDRLQISGHSISDDHDDPVLLDPAGKAVDTWRENYPYDQRLDRADYDEQKYPLQVKLLKLQKWTLDTDRKQVILFEAATRPVRAARSSASLSTSTRGSADARVEQAVHA